MNDNLVLAVNKAKEDDIKDRRAANTTASFGEAGIAPGSSLRSGVNITESGRKLFAVILAIAVITEVVIFRVTAKDNDAVTNTPKSAVVESLIEEAEEETLIMEDE